MPTEQPTFTPEELASEIWKPIPDFEEHYEASTLGRLKSLSSYRGKIPGTILKAQISKRGRHKVSLFKNNVQSYHLVAVLIARTFLGPKPEGMEVDHKDLNKLNDRANNLEYVTHEINVRRAKDAGVLPAGDNHYSRTSPEKLARGERHPNSKVTDAQRDEIRHRYIAGETCVELGAAFGLHWSSVRAMIPDGDMRPAARRKKG